MSTTTTTTTHYHRCLLTTITTIALLLFVTSVALSNAMAVDAERVLAGVDRDPPNSAAAAAAASSSSSSSSYLSSPTGNSIKTKVHPTPEMGRAVANGDLPDARQTPPNLDYFPSVRSGNAGIGRMSSPNLRDTPAESRGHAFVRADQVDDCDIASEDEDGFVRPECAPYDAYAPTPDENDTDGIIDASNYADGSDNIVGDRDDVRGENISRGGPIYSPRMPSTGTDTSTDTGDGREDTNGLDKRRLRFVKRRLRFHKRRDEEEEEDDNHNNNNNQDDDDDNDDEEEEKQRQTMINDKRRLRFYDDGDGMRFSPGKRGGGGGRGMVYNKLRPISNSAFDALENSYEKESRYDRRNKMSPSPSFSSFGSEEDNANANNDDDGDDEDEEEEKELMMVMEEEKRKDDDAASDSRHGIERRSIPVPASYLLKSLTPMTSMTHLTPMTPLTPSRYKRDLSINQALHVLSRHVMQQVRQKDDELRRRLLAIGKRFEPSTRAPASTPTIAPLPLPSSSSSPSSSSPSFADLVFSASVDSPKSKRDLSINQALHVLTRYVMGQVREGDDKLRARLLAAGRRTGKRRDRLVTSLPLTLRRIEEDGEGGDREEEDEEKEEVGVSNRRCEGNRAVKLLRRELGEERKQRGGSNGLTPFNSFSPSPSSSPSSSASSSLLESRDVPNLDTINDDALPPAPPQQRRATSHYNNGNHDDSSSSSKLKLLNLLAATFEHFYNSQRGEAPDYPDRSAMQQ